MDRKQKVCCPQRTHKNTLPVPTAPCWPYSQNLCGCGESLSSCASGGLHISSCLSLPKLPASPLVVKNSGASKNHTACSNWPKHNRSVYFIASWLDSSLVMLPLWHAYMTPLAFLSLGQSALWPPLWPPTPLIATTNYYICTDTSFQSNGTENRGFGAI